MSSRVGWIFLAAIALKALVRLAGPTLFAWAYPVLEYFDRILSFALLVLAGIWAFRFTATARSRMLWRVSRKLALSYILVGAVPILLLVAFSLLAFLLVFLDISSYVVQDRFGEFTEQAGSLARATLFEIERAPVDSRREVLGYRQAALQTEHPGISLALVPTAGGPPCGGGPFSDGLEAPSPSDRVIYTGPWKYIAIPAVLPRWVSCDGFAGLLLGDEPGSIGRLHIVARAAALPEQRGADYAIIVDLPLDEPVASRALEGTGIEIGDRRSRSLFNTATFLTYTDWQRGLTAQATLPMSVQVTRLYRWVGGTYANAAFNKVLLYVLLGVGALLLVIEAVALANGLALARSITASVDGLFAGTKRVKGADFGQAIAVRSDDQLGELAASFNEMTDRIGTLLVEQGEKRRLEEELRIARSIQMSLLPQEPFDAVGLSIGGLCVPAREVGGDYYDFLPLEDGRLGLLIADVSGKGTSAALYMAEMKGLMLSLSRMHTSPRELLVEANRIISRHLGGRSFITMIYAVVDSQAKELTCARAGHTPFIRIPAASGARSARVIAPEGIVLGLDLENGVRFERSLKEVKIPFEPGDLFFFYTDGISEAMDRQGQCFGEARLAAFLEEHAHLPVAEIRVRLVEEITRFAAGQPQHDDITMIIVKVER